MMRTGALSVLESRTSVLGDQGVLETGSHPPRRSQAGTGQVRCPGALKMIDEAARPRGMGERKWRPAALADTWHGRG